MNKYFRIFLLGTMLFGLAFISTRPAFSMVGPQALSNCKGYAFSTSEDFLTQGPIPPDGNPIISDGDLLGPNCTVCARNADLLQFFDVPSYHDLGLDAVDVIDVDLYLVAFSTELDSSNLGQFSAGDLLIIKRNPDGSMLSVVIPNLSLTYSWGINYDIGLDAVHFVGALDNIILFVDEAIRLGKNAFLETPDLLVGMLKQYEIDIWYSTEGTWTPAGAVGFLDGDLLSASAAIDKIVLTNDELLPLGVPAGLPVRGVDFGLDAVTSNREIAPRRVHFSTEILYESDEFSFTDGDLLLQGNGVLVTNKDLVACFEPKSYMLGLDAFSVQFPDTYECVSRLTSISGVAVEDIDPTTGLAQPGVVSGILAPVPFGGAINFQGTICPDVDEFRVVYRKAGTSDPWEPMKVLLSKDWRVKVDSFFPPEPDCFGSQNWFSDGDGWFNGPDYRHLSEAGYGGCNPDLSLTVWESTGAISGADELYEVVLETMTTSGLFSDTLRLVQLDNTAPVVELEKEYAVCDELLGSDMPYLVTGRMQDEYFYQYRLRETGDGYPTFGYPVVKFYDDPGDNVIDIGTINWPNYVGLHPINLFDLVPPEEDPIACCYSIWLTGWDRALVGSFFYPSNLVTRCAGCRHSDDIWTFSFSP